MNGDVFRYSPKPLEELLTKLFKDCRLSDCLTHTFVTGMEIPSNRNIILSSWTAQRNECWDFFVRDVARATCVAPTYFPAAVLSSAIGDPQVPPLTVVDGGLSLNNPGELVCKNLKRLFSINER